MPKKISGVITALVTPFDHQGNVDFKSLENLVAQQLKAGVRGFVVNGTTAESPTLEKSEVKEIWQLVREKSNAETILILGTGSNSTAKTIENTKDAIELKADAALVVVPYYNKPPQRGLFQHFKKVAEETGAPILLYNVPGRTACNMSAETTIELSFIKNMIGIKDASGDTDAAETIRKKSREGFVLLSGDDGTYVDFLTRGGDGIISVGSHIVPEIFVKLTELVKFKKFDQAKTLMDANKDLIDALYVEANPIPVKKALMMMKLISTSQMRLPLISAQASTEEKLKFEMKKRGILE
jgi:4-hydroxy-tetrahydrodipicolinate synthase